MAQFRIIKREHFSGPTTICRYFVAQSKQSWLSSWKDITYFYKSEFEDMPGSITSICNDEVSARLVMEQAKKGVHITDSLVYQD